MNDNVPADILVVSFCRLLSVAGSDLLITNFCPTGFESPVCDSLAYFPGETGKCNCKMSSIQAK